MNRLAAWAASENKGDDATSEVFVYACESLYGDRQPGFLGYLTHHAVLERFVKLQDATRRLPVAVVPSTDHEHSVLVVDDNTGNAD